MKCVRTLKLICVLFVSIITLKSFSQSTAVTATGGDSKHIKVNLEDRKWTLVFQDDFNTNLDQWNIWEGGAFNNEIQLYTKEQLNVSNGVLTITAQKKAVTGVNNPYDSALKAFSYTSGKIESKKRFGPSNNQGEGTYRIIARMRLPKGHGMWPAFWCYANPWPTKGEIDILEAKGNNLKAFQSNIFYGIEPNISIVKHEYTERTYDFNTNLTANFHDYELVWSKDSLEIFFDGKPLYKYTADGKNHIADIFGNKLKIVLNLAVGGDFFFGMHPSTFVDTSTFQIDWIKVYKK
jgi:beta-glucanase (GH16 family)